MVGWAIIVGLATAGVGGLAGWFLNNRFGRKSLEAATKRTACLLFESSLKQVLPSLAHTVVKEDALPPLEGRIHY